METTLDIIDRRLGFVEHELKEIETLIEGSAPTDSMAGFYTRLSELQSVATIMAVAAKEKYQEYRNARR